MNLDFGVGLRLIHPEGGSGAAETSKDWSGIL
jgi:hypothetical protein